MKTKYKNLGITALILSLIFALSACGQKEKNDSKSEDKTEFVKTITLESQLIANTLEFTSTLIANEEVHLAPAQPGRIEKINVEIGSRFKQGDLLFTMDQTQLNQAKIQFQNLELDFKRLDTLRKTGSIAMQQYDQLKTQYEISKKNIQFLEENSRLRAPFSGVVAGKYYENGEMFSGAPNTLAGKAAVITLVQINPLKAIVSISESNYSRIKSGMSVDIVSDNFQAPIKGKVISVYPTIDPITRTFKVEISVPNAKEELRPGMFCRAKFDLDKTEALLAPSSAVLKLQGSNERYVFIEENGLAARKSVTIGRRFDDQVEIISNGVKAGDKLIVSGQARLLDGMKIEVKN